MKFNGKLINCEIKGKWKRKGKTELKGAQMLATLNLVTIQQNDLCPFVIV